MELDVKGVGQAIIIKGGDAIPMHSKAFNAGMFSGVEGCLPAVIGAGISDPNATQLTGKQLE